MPFTIGETVPSSYVRPAHSQAFKDPSWNWLAKQQFDVNAAWAQQGNYRRGTLTGGPSYERFLDFGNEQQWAIAKPRPILTAPILPDEQQFYRRQLGAVEWDSINPFNTIDQAADQVKQATGEDPLGFLRGASDFLASKDVDIMGQGSTGAPARAADYALAFPIAIFNKMTGQASVASMPLAQDDIYHAFHADPRYWHAVQTGTPAELDQLAYTIASAHLNPEANSYYIEQLKHQFQVDRDKASALTSGNAAIDYQAIKAGTVGTPGAGTGFGLGFPKIPLFGTQMAELVDPITPAERATWAGLDPKVRADMLGHFGALQMATDFIGAFPALSGLGSVLALARGGGVVTRTIAEGYDWTLRGAGYLASAGLAAATANWALEASWPGYSEFLGNDVDHARPISGSNLAGVVNTIGYWASGTYGASNLIRGGVKTLQVSRRAGQVVREMAAAERGVTPPSSGLPEMPLYVTGHGGARMDNLIAGTGLDPRGLRTSKQRLVLSELVHLARKPDVDIAAAAMRGEPTGRIEIDNLPPEEKILAANDLLQAGATTSHYQAELYARVLAVARQPAKLFRSDGALKLLRWYKGEARTIENAIAERYIGAYGPAWIRRVAGAYTADAMEAYTKAAIKRMGGDAEALTGKIKGEERWAQAMRSVHQYEFDYRNGELAAALDAPGLKGDLPNERGKLSMVSSRHLFNDQAEASLAILRGDDLAAAQAEVSRLIDGTEEGERWFTQDWKPPNGAPHERELVKPAQMASWIEDVQPGLLVRRGHPDPHADTAALPVNALHQRLIDDGVWELAFKPVDAEGNFVSYIHTRDGATFQTPWLDYPLGNADNIELGNRGMAMAKYDAMARGFRTWRVAEFQRASLFRDLTSRFPFTSSQIEAFHSGLLTEARRHSVQPQTFGTVSQGLAGVGTAFNDAVEKLARETFGEGPYLTRTGTREAIDWRRQIATAYRQSLRLNLTAGLTSHLKSRFGPIGANAAWLSDIGYVNLRFNLSPLFKIGEVEESLQFNAMAGVNPGGDPWLEALMYRAGIGDDFGVAAAEATYDQTMQGLAPSGWRGKKGTTPAERRQAASYVFYAKQAPETFEQKAAAAAIQARVEAYQNFTAGGNSVFASPRHALETELAQLTDEFGNILPGAEDRADEISKILTGQLQEDEVRALHHVSQELPSEEWSLDPGDLGSRDYLKDESMQGLPGWIDEATLPEDRGLWHTTTAIDAVHASGLRSRSELIAQQWGENHDLVKALTAGVDEGNGQWRDMTVTYADQGREVTFHPAMDDIHNLTSAKPGKPYEGELYDHYVGKPVAPSQIVKVEVGGKTTWKREGGAPANMGLGAARPDAMVSLTTDYNHASTIAERMRLAIGSARNETTITHILDHFWQPLEDAAGIGSGGVDAFYAARGVASNIAHDMSATSGLSRTKAESFAALSAAIDRTTNEQELNALLTARFTTGELKYNLVKKLDMRLDHSADPQNGFQDWNRVVLTGDWQSMATSDPAQVGIVQVGIKKGAGWRTGPDSFEVQMPSEDIWVVDRRILDQPLATDKAGLLAQLNQTVRQDGSTIPGFEAYRQRVTDELAALDVANKPLGELVPQTFRSALTDYPNHPNAEYVPTTTLAQFVEMDREVVTGTRPPGYLDAFEAHVRERIAAGLPPFEEPVIIAFDPATNSASIGDGNHRIAIAKRLHLPEVPARVSVDQWRAKPGVGHEPRGAGWHPLPDEAVLKAKLDGYIPADAKPSQIFSQRVDQVTQMEDVFGTPENLVKTVAEQGDESWLKPGPFDEPGYARKAWETLKNPVPMKQRQATLMRIELLRRQFPQLLHAAGQDGFAEVMNGLNIPERDWLPFLLRDRELATDFHNSGTPEAFQALLDHTGSDARGKFDELYASEDWAAITGLFAIAGRTASDEAFRVHFFNPYRSAIERSLNHPLTGIYPLSWAYKAARQWMSFLYENRTIPELRLGMAPAVAINSIVRAQNIAFAQSNPEDLETYIGTSGPFGSAFMIFNLMLPGDWSTIPFPASRTIRDAVRGNLGVQTLERNILSLGVARDGRLLSELGGEVKDFVWGPDNPDPNKPLPPWRPHPNTPDYRPSTTEQAYR